MKQKLFFTLISALSFIPTSVAVGEESSGKLEVNAGLRSGRFQAAPRSESLWLQESGLGGYSPTLMSFGSLAFSAGGNLSVSQMRGDLGPGLTALTGYRVNPSLKFEQTLTGFLSRLSVFSALGYAYTTFTGRGSDSWDANQSSALFLLGAESIEQRSKKYVAQGPNVTAGVAYGITDAFSVSTSMAVSFETMTGSSPIFNGGREVANKETTSFTSRSVLLGGGYSL
jgi:hypothetical protein